MTRKPAYVGLRRWYPNPLTGGHVGLYDGRAAQFDTDAGRWTSACETHGTTIADETFDGARSTALSPADWCEDCQALQVNPTPEEATTMTYDPNALPGTPGNPSTGGTRTAVVEAPATYIYRYHFTDRGTGQVVVAIFTDDCVPRTAPGTPGPRFGYDAEAMVSDRYVYDGPKVGTQLVAEVSQASIGAVPVDDALLRIDVYSRAARIAAAAQRLIDAGVNPDPVVLALPPQGVEVDGNGNPVTR